MQMPHGVASNQAPEPHTVENRLPGTEGRKWEMESSGCSGGVSAGNSGVMKDTWRQSMSTVGSAAVGKDQGVGVTSLPAPLSGDHIDSVNEVTIQL